MLGQTSWTELFLSSPLLWILLGCSIVTVGFAVERLLYFRASRTDARAFLKELASYLKVGNSNAALEFCRSGESALARVMRQATLHLDGTRAELQASISTAIEKEQVAMERHLGVLGTISHVAPLLGLLGTVVGIIRAFGAVARTGAGGASVVAGGVAEALATTAAGIVVAVLATVAYNAFVRLVRCHTVELEDARETYLVVWSRFTQLYHRGAHRGAGAQTAPAAAGGVAPLAPRAPVASPGSETETRPPAAGQRTAPGLPSSVPNKPATAPESNVTDKTGRGGRSDLLEPEPLDMLG